VIEELKKDNTTLKDEMEELKNDNTTLKDNYDVLAAKEVDTLGTEKSPARKVPVNSNLIQKRSFRGLQSPHLVPPT
jgi:hypothetical protein